jgi:hypothetical protein
MRHRTAKKVGDAVLHPFWRSSAAYTRHTYAKRGS